MSPQPPVPPEPEPAPTPAPADEPEWAKRLRESIDALPAKLKAFVSDDDKRGIAETVHGLFEQSGAFVKEDPKPDDPADPADPPADLPEPEPATKKPNLATRLGFPAH